MTSHLRVTIDDIDLVLAEDTSISIELKNPYLNEDIDTYSYQFDVPIDGNRELLGDIDNPDSDIRMTSIEGHPMAIYVDGILFAHGKVATIDEQTIVDKVSISMTSNKKQLKDLIGEITCRDIPLMSATPTADEKKVLKIGEMIGDITVQGNSYYNIFATFYDPDGNIPDIDTKEKTNQQYSQTRKLQLQALGFSANKHYTPVSGSLTDVKKDAEGKPEYTENYINVSYAYNEQNPDAGNRRSVYYNSQVCYLHHGVDKDDDGTIKSSDYVIYDESGYGAYFLLPADRPQSGICFYVMFVLERLFKYLELIYDPAVIEKVEDMKHLLFFTTRCKYTLEHNHALQTYVQGNNQGFETINKWLSERNCGGSLSAREVINNGENDTTKPSAAQAYIYTDIFGFSSKQSNADYDVYIGSKNNRHWYSKRSYLTAVRVMSGSTHVVKVHYENGEVVNKTFKCEGWMIILAPKDEYTFGASVMDMYANSENLPEMSVTSLLDSLWGSFGLRFYYDTESNQVEPYFIRDVLRTNNIHTIYGDDISVRKIAEKITGVRIKYNTEADRKEQIANVYKGVTDYDTKYDYLVEKNDPIETSLRYADFSRRDLSVGDYTCYIDPITGNAYRVKINKEELDNGNVNGLQPSMFQVAQYKGIDVYSPECDGMTDADLLSNDVQDYVVEIVSDFEPLVQNDLNAKRNDGTQKLVPFVSEDMWNETVEMDPISNVVDSSDGETLLLDEHVSTMERYDVHSADNGNSPLQSTDWGNSICLMRGSGADSHRVHFARNYDGFNNEKWRYVAGNAGMDSDCVDAYGAEYDYNTDDIEGIGNGERISLNIRAYSKSKTGEILITDPKGDYARRGLADKFFSEYIYFLLHRKKLAIKTMCEIEHIIDMQWKDKYSIAGHTGWIDQLSVKVSMQKGIEDVEFTMFEL